MAAALLMDVSAKINNIESRVGNIEHVLSKKQDNYSTIEESWEDGKFQGVLEDMEDAIEVEVAAHDDRQTYFRRADVAWKVVITSMSIVSAIIIAFTKKYYPGLADMATTIALTAVIPGLLGLYGFFDPAGFRAVHLMVSGQKDDIKAQIHAELLKKSKKREIAHKFYRWIYRDYARVGGTPGAYLPMPLLQRYKDVIEEANESSESSDESSDSENVPLIPVYESEDEYHHDKTE